MIANKCSTLLHLLRESSDEEAFERLKRILRDKILFASNGLTSDDRFIKGKSVAVCLSETPTNLLESVLLGRYRPFGLLFQKEDIFKLGGRPVIYQPTSEYELLPDVLKWRHVKLNLNTNSESWTDFTWEREWRVPENIKLNPLNSRIILPDISWYKKLLDFFYDEYQNSVTATYCEYSLIFDGELALAYATQEPNMADHWNAILINSA